MKILSAFFVGFLMSGFLFSQSDSNTVWLINGKKLTISSYKFVENGNYLAYEKKPGKVKELDRMEIFSITDSKGKEEVFFNPDTLDDRYYTVENMRSFVTGGYDGYAKTKARLSFFSGFLLGLAGCSGYIFENPFYGVIIPAGGITIVGLTSPSMKKIRELSNDEFYLLGYQESAKQVRAVQAIKGSLVGIVVGLGVGIITGKIK
ncbi:MAG: hypothetical protein JXR58_06030 [Bacteroidales bacterium]|nr:hypothetical protein [Bacteroidales bacterium]